MYERSYGYRYGEAENLTTAEIAKRMRADIAQAIGEGLLPGKPVQISVRSDSFSGGSSIDITVKNWPEVWTECDGTKRGSRRTYEDGSSVATACSNHWCAARNDSPHASTHLVLTEEGEAAQMTLERIHNAYNHDGSETQIDYFDVRYYGHVEFETAESARWRAEEKAKKDARRAAMDAAELAGTKRVVVWGRGGTQNVHDAVEVDGRHRLLCGATLWRGSLVSDGDGRDLTCSRCQKREAKRS